MLVDDNVRGGILFVEERVNHPYLKKGLQFPLSGVKDYYYRKQDEARMKITRYTDFTELGRRINLKVGNGRLLVGQSGPDR